MMALFSDKKGAAVKEGRKAAATITKAITKKSATAIASSNKRRKKTFEFALVYKKPSGKLGVRKFRIIRASDASKLTAPH